MFDSLNHIAFRGLTVKWTCTFDASKAHQCICVPALEVKLFKLLASITVVVKLVIVTKIVNCLYPSSSFKKD